MRFKKEPKNILIISLSNIGDVFLTAPVVSRVRSAFPTAAVTLLVGPGAKEVFLDDPRLKEIIPYDKNGTFVEKFRFVRALREKRFDLVVDLRHSLFPLFLGSSHTPLFRRAPRTISHKIDQHLWKLKVLGIPVDSWQKNPLWVHPKSEEKIRTLLGHFGIPPNSPFILLSPGSKSELKRWKASSFGELADRIHREKGFPLVFIGDEDDTPFVKTVVSFMHEPFHSLVGKTSLPDLVPLIRNSKLLVTNDSASLHIASLVGTPTVAIFGPTDPRKYGPRAGRQRTVRKTLFCSPCEKARCPYHHECMEELPTEEVYQACLELLEIA